MTKQDDDDHRECRECERLRAALRESDLGFYVQELAASKTECERLRARESELVAALTSAGRHGDAATEQRRRLSEECERHRREREGDLKRDAERINVAQQESERLRAALLRIRDHYIEDSCFDTADAVADIDAALAGDPHRDFAPIRHVTLDLPGAPASVCDVLDVFAQRAADRAVAPTSRLDSLQRESCDEIMDAMRAVVAEEQRQHEPGANAPTSVPWVRVIRRFEAHDAAVREQVEREIADDCDEVYNKARNGPAPYPDYREGWCNALNMFEQRIRSGAYRAEPPERPAMEGHTMTNRKTPECVDPTKGASHAGESPTVHTVQAGKRPYEQTSDAAPAAVHLAQSGTAVDTPAPPSVAAEDRSEPPPGYRAWRWADSWGAAADIAENEYSTCDAAVAACWAHRDAVREKVEREIADYVESNWCAPAEMAVRIRSGAYRADNRKTSDAAPGGEPTASDAGESSSSAAPVGMKRPGLARHAEEATSGAAEDRSEPLGWKIRAREVAALFQERLALSPSTAKLFRISRDDLMCLLAALVTREQVEREIADYLAEQADAERDQCRRKGGRPQHSDWLDAVYAVKDIAGDIRTGAYRKDGK